MASTWLDALSIPAPSWLDGGRVKGSLLRLHLDCARDHGSRQEFIELFAAMPAPLRRQTGALVSEAWYPSDSLIEVDRLIIDHVGGGSVAFAELEIGPYVARRVLRDGSRFSAGPHHCLRYVTLLLPEWYDSLTGEWLESGERSATMIHRGHGATDRLECAWMRGFYGESVRLHGGSEPAVRESACRCRADSFCAFEISWH